MLQRIIRIILLVVGFAIGYQLVSYGFDQVAEAFNNVEATTGTSIGVSIVGGSIFGLISYIISPWLMGVAAKINAWMESAFKAIPTQDIAVGVIGLVIGLLIGALLSLALQRVPLVGTYLSLAVTLFLGYFGMSLMLNRKEEMTFLTGLFTRQGRSSEQGSFRSAKILDTSVIIDGRIVDITSTGFVEGIIVIPGFVLEELRHIADSSDTLKRNRGRRGLDILNKMQKESIVPIQIVEQDFDDIPEVDSKLVKLAKVMKGKIVTNDYNLNKVCELQGVPVLNINELANAVKPIVLPGEEMAAQIIKDGKEHGQGVAYLDDGTMIVVEGGRRFIGDTIEVVVTSVLQTAAGRMIFAKPKLEKVSGAR
ncbi:PIN/TRAM domain-containing protein [Dethiobacter alkaliphilus]|uniref:PilT protein domain protein n=1 Tax=Dethiobacter alkaliphilus AHT 1 TaxID=555088 RepID=C0GIM1_DETAL|nr:PIN/TRAM domain-containing protein [Dethiobacter alkaliphilus]EEG76882.1 PilT protein domain protein [Dethiobacter alkaliphilus AHT 1]